MDEHSGFDGMEGRCKRLREIMREATEVCHDIGFEIWLAAE